MACKGRLVHEKATKLVLTQVELAGKLHEADQFGSVIRGKIACFPQRTDTGQEGGGIR